MRRTRAARTIAVLLAFWFAAFSAAPGALHACPMHDGGLALVDAGSAMHSAAGHAMHADHHGGSQSHDAHHLCSCPGPCDGASAMAQVPHVALAVLATVTPARAADRPGEPLRRRPSTPEHARPPSLGPPTLHVG